MAGWLPPLTADGARRVAALPARTGPLTGPESFSPLERCLSRGALGSMLPVGNTNGNQIIQAPGLVVVLNEMVHEARLIPVDGHPHLGAKIRSHMGDSRGRWEGQTLIVETINFNDQSNYIVGVPGTRIASYSRDARLTERFTRIDADTLRYEATVDDPRTWTRSWTVAFPLKRDPSYQLFEYACHEENYSMPHMLRTRPGITAPLWTPMHPAGLRCSSLTYTRYARSSRLAGRAPRRPEWHTYSRTGPKGCARRGELTIAAIIATPLDIF